MLVVRSIGAGRVLLDFNPALAGKNLIYDVVVAKKLETDQEKIGRSSGRVPAVEENQFRLILQDQNLTIEMPEVAFYVEGIQIAKRGVALDFKSSFRTWLRRGLWRLLKLNRSLCLRLLLLQRLPCLQQLFKSGACG